MVTPTSSAAWGRSGPGRRRGLAARGPTSPGAASLAEDAAYHLYGWGHHSLQAAIYCRFSCVPELRTCRQTILAVMAHVVLDDGPIRHADLERDDDSELGNY
jgi:hypothetical protein